VAALAAAAVERHMGMLLMLLMLLLQHDFGRRI